MKFGNEPPYPPIAYVRGGSIAPLLVSCCLRRSDLSRRGRPRFRRTSPSSHSGRGPYSAAGPLPAPSRVLLPPRLILPASTTVKRSLWVFRTPKLKLLKD